MNPLLSRRVHFVAGKGGVGKSTVAVGLALVAARAGKRVLLVEIEHGGRAGAYLDLPDPAGYEARRSPSGVWTLTVDGRASLEEYLGLVVPVKRVLSAVFHTKIYQYFVAAAPGLKELMAVGKVWYEAERKDDRGTHYWDVVIVDAPATGHSLQYLRMPKAARDTFGPGLVRQEAARVQALLENPEETAVHLVSTGEDMPVTETIEAHAVLRDELQLPLGMVVVNRVHRGTAPQAVADALRAGASRLPSDEARVATAVADCATEENSWAAINRTQIERLRAAVPLPMVVLPEVYAEEFAAGDVARLSELLAVKWDVRARHEGIQREGRSG